MKNIGIVTINDNNNYGNRLQNYAVQEVIGKIGSKAITIRNIPQLNDKSKFFLRSTKYFLKQIKSKLRKNNIKLRKEKFEDFNKNIVFSKNVVTPFSNIKNNYDYFLVGSDQVWNPNFGRLRDIDLLTFANNNQRIAFSASFGIGELPDKYHDKLKRELSNFRMLSVREDAGKNIIEDVVKRNDVEVLIDPTMLLNSEEWDKVSKRPEQLKNDKYILNYFLGELSESRRKEIERIAKENECEIINILDKNSPFYQTGPSEFLYLEKNAFLICTDSFHSCVFSILYNRPFIVFEREDNKVSMNSRIDTLISKFELKNRKFIEKITNENLECDYMKAYEILEVERKKAINYLKKALDIQK